MCPVVQTVQCVGIFGALAPAPELGIQSCFPPCRCSMTQIRLCHALAPYKSRRRPEEITESAFRGAVQMRGHPRTGQLFASHG